MSLVSDALKKAEREAAAREAREKGLPVPLETPSQPYRARRGQRRGGAWLGIFAGVGVALAVAFVLSRTAPEEKAAHKGSTATTSSPAASPAEPVTSSPPATAPPPGNEPSTAAAHASNAEPTAPRPSAGEPTAPEPSPPSPKTAPIQGAAPPSASEPRAPSAAPRPAPRTSKEFVRRVDFPDGSKLELGGIAYSETAPFAYLNGRLLKTGEAIAGYTLVVIERDRVVVRGAAGELTLRLKPR